MATAIEQEIAAEAVAWIDTPFVWGQSQKGRGCDCKGLLAGVMRELGRPEAESIYATFGGYRVDRPVPSALLVEGMAALFDQVDEVAPGRLLLLKFGGHAGHLAIVTSEGRAVHAFPGRSEKVCERDLAVLFHRYPLHSVWRVRPCR
jgi:cell wall-associated NlpC family hydrolase